MRNGKSFDDYVNRLRELSGIKNNDDVFKKLEDSISKPLTEEEIKLNELSGLSRIGQHINDHDISIVTAFRDEGINCIDKTKNTNIEYTKKENLERNKKLYSSLLVLKYGITSIDGSFIENYGSENSKEVKENSYLVVNLNDDTDFIENMINLGKYFCQDSVLLKRKGSDNAYLYGTNNHKIPGLGNTIDLGKHKPGIESEFMSRINGRPFIFEEFSKLQNNTKYLVTEYSREILNNILK